MSELERLADQARQAAAGRAILPEWRLLDRFEQERWLVAIRAVLETLRKPSDAIAERMSEHAANSMVDWRDLHAAMIDAILAEK